VLLFLSRVSVLGNIRQNKLQNCVLTNIETINAILFVKTRLGPSSFWVKLVQKWLKLSCSRETAVEISPRETFFQNGAAPASASIDAYGSFITLLTSFTNYLL
jgi:hypothetical protein